MKKAQICIFSLLLLVWGVFLQFPALAENSVIITPNIVTISTTRDETESRTIVLRTDQPLSNIKVTALDLHNAEGNKVLPASSLQINPSINQTDTNNLIKIPLKLALKNAPSGEFKGEIVISNQDNQWIVPVIVKVKDTLYLPLLMEDKADEFEQSLNTLLPSNTDELKSLNDEIEKFIVDKRKIISETSKTLVAKDVDGSGQPQSNLMLQALRLNDSRTYDLSGMNLLTNITSLWQTAQGRLLLFYLSSYLISFTVLAGSGFNELYLSKPTFGANGWGDYLTLLAWGFGAEATRNMATQVVRKTDESDS